MLSLPATDEDAARELVAALRATHPFTWTAGIDAARPGDELASVLFRADAQLYRRKRDQLA